MLTTDDYDVKFLYWVTLSKSFSIRQITREKIHPLNIDKLGIIATIYLFKQQYKKNKCRFIHFKTLMSQKTHR